MRSPRLVAAAATIVVAATAIATPPASAGGKTLKRLAKPHGLQIGTAANVHAIRGDATYRKHIRKQFNVVTPENSMKWERIHPSRDTFDFGPADEIVDAADTNNQFVHGHTLVWHSQVPAWITTGEWTNGELRSMLDEHINTVVGHYAGRVDTWDVVNEAISDEDGKLRDTVWSRTGKNKYVRRAFKRARKADEKAILCYNDYNHADSEGWQKTKADAVFKMVRKMVRKKTPIDCVGFQLHIDSNFEHTGIAENFARYAKLGLQVQITELDVRLPEPPSEADLETQARLYGELMEICVDAPNCTAFIMWGFTDRYSWVPGVFSGWGSATIMTEGYQRKPAFNALRDALK